MTHNAPAHDFWDNALCRQIGADEWFPEKGASNRTAKTICNGNSDRPPCPVKTVCLQWALDNDERFGVWGGLTEKERRPLRRQRQVAA